MIDPNAISARFALDVASLDHLRSEAHRNPDRALKSAARQFEAVFMNMLLKSMREAVPQDGLFDSEQTRLYNSMLDQQLAQSLAAKGLGLADLLVRQLSRSKPDGPSPAPAVSPAAPGSTPAPPPAAPAPEKEEGPRGFIERLLPHALEASRETGIPARFMLGHAALESGWGRREIRFPDGRLSHNLFGIKAGPGWSGPVVEAATTEYVDGVERKSVEKFRAYGSYAEAFRDYARLLHDNPRYAQVLRASDPAAFAVGLQRAGYATDPRYAEKLARVLAGPALASITTG